MSSSDTVVSLTWPISRSTPRGRLGTKSTWPFDSSSPTSCRPSDDSATSNVYRSTAVAFREFTWSGWAVGGVSAGQPWRLHCSIEHSRLRTTRPLRNLNRKFSKKVGAVEFHCRRRHSTDESLTLNDSVSRRLQSSRNRKLRKCVMSYYCPSHSICFQNLVWISLSIAWILTISI